MKEYIYKKVLKAYSDLEKKEAIRSAELKDAELLLVSQEESIKEMDSMRYDPVAFVEKYAYRIDCNTGFVPVELYPHQKELLRSYEDNRCNIVYSARQMGITLTNALYALHQSFFVDYSTIVVADNKLRWAANMLDDIRIVYDSLPEFYKASNPIVVNNKHEISFKNSSRIIAMPIRDHVLAGISSSLIIADNYNFASERDQAGFYISASISILDHGKFIMTSTGGGLSRLFSEILFDDTNEFVAHSINWQRIERDAKWKESMIDMMGEERWKMEYEVPMIKDNQNGPRTKQQPKKT